VSEFWLKLYYSPQPSTDGKKVFVIGEQLRSELVRYDEKAGSLSRIWADSRHTH
jgi:hypothetical protein